MAKLTGFTKVAVIKSSDGKDRYYAVYDDGNDYKPGDQVLVSGNTWFRAPQDLLTIKAVINADTDEVRDVNITAEVIGKCDITAYQERVGNRKEAEKLKREIDKRVKQLTENNLLEMLVAQDEILAEKYRRYQEIGGC